MFAELPRSARPAWARIPLLTCLLCASTLGGCADESSEAPDPPSMSDLQEEYGSGSGRLSADAAPLIVRGVYARLWQAVQLLGITTAVANVTSTFDDEDDGTDSTESGLGVRRDALSTSGAAWGRVTWKCTGWQDTGRVDDRWGRLVLNHNLIASQVGRVFWGRAEDCHLLTAASDGSDFFQRLTGDIRLQIGSNSEGGWLMSFVGEGLGEGQEALPFDFDLQILTGEEGSGISSIIRTKVLLPDGDRFVVGFGVEEDANLYECVTSTCRVAIQDSEGNWSCTVSANGSSGTCSRDDEEVSW